MDSSDSSEDETNKLKESLDINFINNDLYNGLQNRKDVTQKKEISNINIHMKSEPLVSLRPKSFDDDEFDLFGLTPEFKHFVAKNLAKILDNKLELVSVERNIGKSNHSSGGIKLLKNSKIVLNDNDELNDDIVYKKRRKTTKHLRTVDDLDDNTKFRSVAVNPYDIISKKDTLYWSKRTKRKPFTFKMLNGVLQLVE